jgi:hypothetical protein
MKFNIKTIAITAATVISSVIAVVAYATLFMLHYSGYLPAPPVPSPEHPYEPDFQQSKRLQEILKQIQNHITESTSTCDCFASICQRIDARLYEDARAHLSMDDVRAHFKSN